MQSICPCAPCPLSVSASVSIASPLVADPLFVVVLLLLLLREARLDHVRNFILLRFQSIFRASHDLLECEANRLGGERVELSEGWRTRARGQERRGAGTAAVDDSAAQPIKQQTGRMRSCLVDDTHHHPPAHGCSEGHGHGAATAMRCGSGPIARVCVSARLSVCLRVPHLVLMLAQDGLDVVFHGGRIHG